MKKLIFFVDDDKMIINLLEYTFQSKQQYKFRSFQSGEECITELKSNPDLIVLDHNLSATNSENMNGIETMEKIHQINPAIPVIILTGHGTEELYKEFQDRGASGYLTKDDYFVDSLMEVISSVLL